MLNVISASTQYLMCTNIFIIFLITGKLHLTHLKCVNTDIQSTTYCTFIFGKCEFDRDILKCKADNL